MELFDLCLAWNTQEDTDFVQTLEKLFKKRGLTLLQITSDNFGTLQEKIIANQISFRSFFDRASDDDPRFMFLIQWSREHNVRQINNYDDCSRAINKAHMHFLLINQGLQTPYTILLPSYSEQPELPQIELTPLGEKFIIKPSHGGGGEGVTTQATTWEQVLSTRKENPEDTYLLQVFIDARNLNSRQAWFRNFYCHGEIFSCWWDTTTHVYKRLTPSAIKKYQLETLTTITSTTAQLCNLDLFSNEVTLTKENIFIVIDYVNDQIDLRFQSKAVDGIPDSLALDLAKRLADLVLNLQKP